MEMLEAVRGYQSRRILFRGFPFDVTWSRCTVVTEELQSFRYANYDALLALSGPSRLVRDGSARITEGVWFPTRKTSSAISRASRRGSVRARSMQT